MVVYIGMLRRDNIRKPKMNKFSYEIHVRNNIIKWLINKAEIGWKKNIMQIWENERDRQRERSKMPISKQNKWIWFIIYIYFQFMLRQLTNRTTEQILLDKRGHHSIIFSDIQLRSAWYSVPLVLFTENSMIFAKNLDIDVLNPVWKENEKSHLLGKPFLDKK